MLVLTEVDECNAALLELAHQVEISSLSDTDDISKACNSHYFRVREELMGAYPWNFAERRRDIDLNADNRYSVLSVNGGWLVSPSQAGEYYLPRTADKAILGKPDTVYEAGTEIAEDTIGALAASRWAWGDNDSLGYRTLYVRLSDDVDPDTRFDADDDTLLVTEYDEPASRWTFALPFPGDMLVPLGLEAMTTASEQPWDNERHHMLTDSACVELVYTSLVTDPSDWDKYFRRAFELMLAYRLALPVTKSRNMRDDMLVLHEEAIADAVINNALNENFIIRKTLSQDGPDSSWQTEGHVGNGRVFPRRIR